MDVVPKSVEAISCDLKSQLLARDTELAHALPVDITQRSREHSHDQDSWQIDRQGYEAPLPECKFSVLKKVPVESEALYQTEGSHRASQRNLLYPEFLRAFSAQNQDYFLAERPELVGEKVVRHVVEKTIKDVAVQRHLQNIIVFEADLTF